MSKFYDELGNLTEAKVAKLAEEVGAKTSTLMDELLADGMTILEGYAVKDYLKSQIDISVVIALMQHQCKLREKS